MIIDCAMPDQRPWQRVTPHATAVTTLAARLRAKITELELARRTTMDNTRMYDPRTGQTIDLATGAVVGSIELALGAPGPIGRLPRHEGFVEQGHYGRLPETDWQSRYEPADDGWGPVAAAARTDRSGRPIPEPGADPEPLLAPTPSDETIRDLTALARENPHLLPGLAELSDHEIARKLITARVPLAAAQDPTILDAQPAVGMPVPGADRLTFHHPVDDAEQSMTAEQYCRDYGLS